MFGLTFVRVRKSDGICLGTLHFGPEIATSQNCRHIIRLFRFLLRAHNSQNCCTYGSSKLPVFYVPWDAPGAHTPGIRPLRLTLVTELMNTFRFRTALHYFWQLLALSTVCAPPKRNTVNLYILASQVKNQNQVSLPPGAEFTSCIVEVYSHCVSPEAPLDTSDACYCHLATSVIHRLT